MERLYMKEECFITTDKDRAYIDEVGKDYIIIKDIFTHEPIKIEVGEPMAKFWKNECLDDTVYVLYDKEKKILL